MNIGLIGLGKMGLGMAKRLLAAGHVVVAYDKQPHATIEVLSLGGIIVDAPELMYVYTDIVWLMVPADVVDSVLEQLSLQYRRNMIIVDGGNSKWEDSQKRAEDLKKYGIYFIDCGVSGGIEGADQGYCLMVGGDQEAYNRIEPIFQALAAPQGYLYCGGSGAGHYTKMVHNGIEYALLQAYAEGFHLLREGEFKDLDLHAIALLWNNGSVIRSWILSLIARQLSRDQQLSSIKGSVQESGMGAWAAEQARLHKVPMPALDAALEQREWSRKNGGNYATKLIAMLRNIFGGHPIF